MYKYDVDGNEIENIIFKNGSPHQKSNYSYDENNNKVLEKVYDSNGIIVSKDEYKYDSFRNIIEKNSINPIDNTLDYSTTYEYKYDNKQNWIQMIVLKNGIADYIEKRRIEYYE